MNFIFFIFLAFILLYFLFFYKKIMGILKEKKFYVSTILLFASFFVSFLWVLYYTYLKEVKLNNTSSDIAFVLDVSQSMDALDYENWNRKYSRLDIWKNLIRNYVLNNPSSRYALTIFSWDYVEVIPFTDDANLFLTLLESSDSNSIINGWNVLKEAYESSIDRFENTDSKGWAIIVLSDFEFPGKSTTFIDNYLWNLNAIKDRLLKNNIKTFLIWLWNKNWSNIVEWVDMFGWFSYKRDNFWNKVVTKFDEYSFNTFSKIIDWVTVRINSSNNLETALSKIENIPSNNLENTTKVKLDFSRYFIIISYFLFLAYMYFYYFERKIDFKNLSKLRWN